MHQPGLSAGSYGCYYLLHSPVAFFKITTVYAHPIDTLEAFYKFKSVGRSCFCCAYANAPIIVLHQVDDWQLMQSSELQSLTHFTFCNRCVAEGTNYNRSFPFASRFIQRRLNFFKVFNTLCNAGSGNYLHARGTALVNDRGFIWSPVIGVIVIFPAAGKNIIAFG